MDIEDVFCRYQVLDENGFLLEELIPAWTKEDEEAYVKRLQREHPQNDKKESD